MESPALQEPRLQINLRTSIVWRCSTTERMRIQIPYDEIPFRRRERSYTHGVFCRLPNRYVGELWVQWKTPRWVAYQAYLLYLRISFWFGTIFGEDARLIEISKLFYSLEAEIGWPNNEQCNELKRCITSLGYTCIHKNRNEIVALVFLPSNHSPNLNSHSLPTLLRLSLDA